MECWRFMYGCESQYVRGYISISIHSVILLVGRKMAENLQTKFRNEIFWKKTVCILIKISQSVFLVAPLAIRQSMLWKEPRAEQATDQYTVKCRYNAVQYCKILNTLLQELRQNINQMRDLKKTPHTSPYRASYGVPFWVFVKKMTAL